MTVCQHESGLWMMINCLYFAGGVKREVRWPLVAAGKQRYWLLNDWHGQYYHDAYIAWSSPEYITSMIVFVINVEVVDCSLRRRHNCHRQCLRLIDNHANEFLKRKSLFTLQRLRKREITFGVVPQTMGSSGSRLWWGQYFHYCDINTSGDHLKNFQTSAHLLIN